jgi:hypothetical protein
MKKLLYIVGIFLIILFVIYLFKSTEPFQNPVVVSNVLIPNSNSSAANEIFLVAPNPSTFNINNAPDTQPYTNGYTYLQAQAACAAVGATLADLSANSLNLLKTIDLSGNWCAAGWTRGDQTNAYFPVSDTIIHKCKLATTSKGITPQPTSCYNHTTGIATPLAPDQFCVPSTPGVGSYKPSNGLAFAVCMGPKYNLPNPTATVNWFNSNSYSMFNPDMMTYLTTGQDLNTPYNSDFFPISMTALQAYYAMQQSNYDPMSARQWLIQNYNTAATTATDPINPHLFTAETPAQAASWNTNASAQTCSQLNIIYRNYDTALTNLSAVFSDLSGSVKDFISIKNENTVLQSVIAGLCGTTTDLTTSMACGRLLSLDYDIFYRNQAVDPLTQTVDQFLQSNTITSLNSLNYNLRVRQCEIQQALGTLELIVPTLNCNLTEQVASGLADHAAPDTPTAADPPSVRALTNKYGINTYVNPAGKRVPIDCNTFFDANGNYSASPTTYNSPSTAFKIGRDIEYNSVETLKQTLRTISPIYNDPDFANLMSEVLNQLSITLLVPDPTQYTSVESIFQTALKTVGTIYNTIVPSST